MMAELVSGAFGFVGVIVGALSATYGARRSQQRDDEKRRTELATTAEDEARVAARILQAETQTASIRLRRAARTGQWWAPSLPMPLETWRSYREPAAKRMPLESWRTVSVWFQTAAATQATVDRQHPDVTGGALPLLNGSVDRNNLEITIEVAERAMEVREKFTGDRLPPSLETPETDQLSTRDT